MMHHALCIKQVFQMWSFSVRQIHPYAYARMIFFHQQSVVCIYSLLDLCTTYYMQLSIFNPYLQSRDQWWRILESRVGQPQILVYVEILMTQAGALASKIHISMIQQSLTYTLVTPSTFTIRAALWVVDLGQPGGHVTSFTRYTQGITGTPECRYSIGSFVIGTN